MPTAGSPIPPGCWPPNCITASHPLKKYISKRSLNFEWEIIKQTVKEQAIILRSRYISQSIKLSTTTLSFEENKGMRVNTQNRY